MELPIPVSSKQKVIAVLTEIDEKEPSFGNIHTFCEELNRLVTEAGDLFYVFSLKDFSKNRVQGFYFNGERWLKEELPLPDFVYNRIHSRWTEVGSRFPAFLEAAAELNITVFNERFLSKWEVHQWLEKHKNLHSFLPETLPFSKSNLMKIHGLYDELYFKPVTGSQGRGIIWLKDRWEIATASKEGMVNQRFQHIDKLYEALIENMNHRPYLIQQGIPLLSFNDKRIDFRVLCHLTPGKQWSVTSMVARLSADHHFAANLALGGEMIRPFEALYPFFSETISESKLEMMEELALEAAGCVTEHFSGLIAELGIDIGVDADGHLWLIEVNSKPSKNSETKYGRIRPSAKAIFEFCQQERNHSEGER